MTVEVLADAEAVARRAADLIAEEARASVAARGRFLLATSGGETPGRMLQHLAKEDISWRDVHLFQVDERVAPTGSPDRNLTQLLENLVGRVAILPGHLHPMPVEESDLESAVNRYAATLQEVAGRPPTLDLVHLGLGADGHTASLVPGDPVVEIEDVDVAVSAPYQGYRRMTLTRPVLNRARRVLWVVTGTGKVGALARLRRGDRSIPAGRVSGDRALIVTDTP
ncbi:MAG TPA: 6-phosphogluconolactonase [Candidatus Eisenbacteria bacterium]|nr:6-phosphogluconolactonase [Candidatus Eisenbacteria bacterium]